jgi:hypothetical protein
MYFESLQKNAGTMKAREVKLTCESHKGIWGSGVTDSLILTSVLNWDEGSASVHGSFNPGT